MAIRTREPPHHRLRAWHSAHQLALTIYRVTESWPSHERFGLVNQARRAAVGIELNIVEGASRKGPREFARFLSIALGSLAELECIVGLAVDLGYVAEEQRALLGRALPSTGGMLWNLLAAQRRAASE